MSAPNEETSARLVLVTGPAGAGRSTTIRALEDLGYETIDNLPLGLVERLFVGPSTGRPLALGLDTRNRDFSPQGLLDLMDSLAKHRPELLYLDCPRDVLQRRYSETRHRHPMAPDESVIEGIDRELDLLVPVRERATALINTSELTVHGLREAIEASFAPREGRHLALSLQSFSYKRGLPSGLDTVFDCRFLNNPYWQPELRALTGQDVEVGAYILQDERFANFILKLSEFLEFLLPEYLREGKSHFSVGLGCTGGQHRSVFVAEKLAEALAQAGWQVSIRHRELDRRGLARGPIRISAGSEEAKA